MTPEELIDQLGRELYRAVVKPIRYQWDDQSARLQDDWRDGARAAIRWLRDVSEPIEDTPGQVALDELLR